MGPPQCFQAMLRGWTAGKKLWGPGALYRPSSRVQHPNCFGAYNGASISLASGHHVLICVTLQRDRAGRNPGAGMAEGVGEEKRLHSIIARPVAMVMAPEAGQNFLSGEGQRLPFRAPWLGSGDTGGPWGRLSAASCFGEQGACASWEAKAGRL